MDTVPVIVDTDAGLDDLLALGYLLTHPAVDVEAVTMAYGLAHGPDGQENLARLLALYDCDHVPIYPGIAEPLLATAPFPKSWRRICSILPGVVLPDDFRRPESETAESFLRRRTGSIAEPVRILALGPLTNLASLVRHGAPGLQEIVTMGGAFEVGGNLDPTPDFFPPNATAEWNYYADPLAAQRVLTSELPVTVIPLDATCHVPVTPAFIDRFNKSARGVRARVMSEVLALIQPRAEVGGFFAWDCLAAMFLTNPEVVHLSEYAIDVSITGQSTGTTRRCSSGKIRQIADWADMGLFEQLYLQAFT